MAEIKSEATVTDVQGEAFQTMLKEAEANAKANLKPDDKVDTPTDKVDDTEGKVDKPDEDLEGDVETLKGKVKGLKAELTKVRQQRSHSTDEAQALRDRVSKLEGHIEALETHKVSETFEGQLKKLTDEQLIENQTSWEDERDDARAQARLAQRDGDQAQATEANQRIVKANYAINGYKKENARRLKELREKPDPNVELNQAKGELESLFTDAYTALPELKDRDSAIWKAGKKEFDSRPALMKQLGPLGELVAVITALAKQPNLVPSVGKQVREELTDKIDKAAGKAFLKPGSSPQSGTKTDFTPNTKQEVLDFEAHVRKVKAGV